MPYEVTWLVENRVMLARHYGVLTSEDLQAYLEESFAMRDHANEVLGKDGPLVHTLTDATEMESQTLGLGDMKSIVANLRQQRVGWSVYVNPDTVTRFLSSVGHQLVRVRYKAFSTMPEALAFLQEVDETLPELKMPVGTTNP